MLVQAEITLIVSVAVLTATITMVLFRQRSPLPNAPAPLPEEPLSFLFDQGILHHASQRALHQFSFLPGQHDWDDLRVALQDQFPEIPQNLADGASGNMVISPRVSADPSRLEISWRDSLCWVNICEDVPPVTARDHSVHLQSLCCALVDQAVWEQAPDGSIGWRNAACDQLLNHVDDATRTLLTQQRPSHDPQRFAINRNAADADWYEVRASTIEGVTLGSARRITEIVNAEAAKLTLVQTIAKTFAHLSTGLAIFDRHGNLNIFNPALVDLTGLKASFLVTQPSMLSFFDQLREERSMPEPKNYSTWRQEIAQLIAAAADGNYKETWTLDDGRTFAVQGRPHPDGATAFMIEDISPEMTLTRNFRKEVAQYEALLDATDDAIVAFSSVGVLTFCNAVYRRMWGQNPESAFADVTLRDCIAIWEKAGAQRPDWERVVQEVTTLGPTPSRSFTIDRPGAAPLTCSLVPVSSDVTMLRFSPQASATKSRQRSGANSAV